MNKQQLPRTTLLLGAALACCSLSWAAPKDETPQARFQRESAACVAGTSHQSRATCMDEARSALAQAKRGALDDKGAPYEVNARKRCEPLPVEERQACLLRMDGAGRAEGSVEAGGIYRELVLIERMDPLPTVAQAPDRSAKQ